MGETADLRNQLAGTFSLNDFIRQGDNEATVRKLVKAILPTMDLKDFRRRFRIDTQSLAMTVGQVITDLRWIVPRGEAWRVHSILMENTDSAPHFIQVRMSYARGADSRGGAFFPVARVQVGTGFDQPVYGLTQQNVTSTTFSSFPDIVLEPGDFISLTDLTALVDAATAQGFQIVYEIVPQPTETRTQGVGGVAIIT